MSNTQALIQQADSLLQDFPSGFPNATPGIWNLINAMKHELEECTKHRAAMEWLHEQEYAEVIPWGEDGKWALQDGMGNTYTGPTPLAAIQSAMGGES